VKNGLVKLGAQLQAALRSTSSGSFEYPPQSPGAPAGYPMPGTAFSTQPGYPPQAGYPPAYPPPGYMPYQAPEQTNSTELAEMKRQLDEAASQQKIAEMERQLHAEKMKNDIRKEMDTTSRVAATEAAQRAASSATPIIVNNNNNNAAAGGDKGGVGGTGVPRLANAKSTYIVQETKEKHCGCLSFIIFLFFPCIVCCPVDERVVEHKTQITV